MHPRVQEVLTTIQSAFAKLSARERILSGIAAGTIFIALLVYGIIGPALDAFESQQIELTKLEQDAKTLAILLRRYRELEARRGAIEERYKAVEMREGVRAHLEALVKSKAGIPFGYNIKSGRELPFGSAYVQENFSLKFDTVNFKGVVDFLDELVRGTRPLILTRLDIRKGRNAENLTVELDVSSLRRAAS